MLRPRSLRTPEDAARRAGLSAPGSRARSGAVSRSAPVARSRAVPPSRPPSRSGSQPPPRSGSRSGSQSGSAPSARPEERGRPVGASRDERRERHAGGAPGAHHATRRRTRLVGAIFCAGFAALSLRLADVQIASAASWRSRGEQQRMDIRPIPASRGDLLDRYGAPLALSVPVFDLVVDQGGLAEAPHYAAAIDANAARLAPLIGASSAGVASAMRGTSRRYVLARGLDDLTAQKVREARVPGVFLEERTVRRYPAGNTARGVVGRVAPDQRGKSGLEMVLDRRLLGRDGEQRIEFGRGGRSIPQGEYTIRPAQNGASIVSTLDRAMQFRVEEVLSDWVTVTGAKGGTVVIMDVRSGDVLVMASVQRRGAPVEADVAADAIASVDELPVVNAGYPAAVVDTFEPGSMLKAITVSGALDNGIISTSDTLVVPDRLRVADHVFSDDTPHPHLKWTVREILTNSSNTGTIMIARRMGKELIDQNLVRFGFGRPSDLGFPYEAAGKWLVPRRWTGTSIGTIPIGQGVTVTALQMVAAFNAIANDGVWVAPRLQRGWVDAAGRRHEDRPAAGHEVVSPTTARAMRSLLADVVKDGSGRNAAVLGYQVAGKTGTARKAIGGQYVKGAYVSSFAGMFPASSPRLSMIVTVDEPRTDIYASTVAAPLFGEITRMAAQRYRIAPASADVALNVRAPQWSAALADAQAARREATLADAARQERTARSGRSTAGATGTATDATGTADVTTATDSAAADAGPTTAVRAAAANRSGGSGGAGGTVAATDDEGENQSPVEPVTPRRRVASWPPTSAVASEGDGPATPVRQAATGRSPATVGGQPVAAVRTATRVEDPGP